MSYKKAIYEKNIISRVSLLVACTLLLGGSVFAQDEKNEWLLGLTFAPQAQWDMKSAPQQINAPLFVATTLVSGKWVASTFYNTSNNSQGLFVNYQVIDEFGVYGVVTKGYSSEGGYLGLGVGTPLAKGRATGFIEIGSGYGSDLEFKPLVFFGMFIPFTVTLKKW